MLTRKSVFSGLSLTGGVSQALFPAIILMTAGRIFTTEEKGEVAVITAVAGLIAQLFFVFVVESRLTTAEQTRSVRLPVYISILGIVGGVLLMASVGSILALIISVPLALISLEVGRGVGVSQRHDQREIAATGLISVGMVVALASLGPAPQFSLIALGGTVLLANIVRIIGKHEQQGVRKKGVLKWLLIDVLATGSLYPALSAAVLIALGPNDAYLFAAITTAAGVIGIPVTYLRTRLLQQHSRSEIVIASLAVAGASIFLLLSNWLGLLQLLFGTSWSSGSTMWPLLLASCWKALGLWAILPLVRLRRVGGAKSPTLLRILQSCLTFGLAIALLPLGSLAVVFAVLCFGEILQAGLYEIALKRHRESSVESSH